MFLGLALVGFCLHVINEVVDKKSPVEPLQELLFDLQVLEIKGHSWVNSGVLVPIQYLLEIFLFVLQSNSDD